MIQQSFFIFLIALIPLVPILQQVDATGGAGQIKDLIDPMIERAIQAIKNNNTDIALYEIENLKKELSDTYEADKDKDKND